MAKTAPLWINAVLFQLNWFICIFAPTYWLVASTLMLLLVHQVLFVKSLKEWRLMVALASAGFFLDSLMAHLGFLQFDFVDRLSLGGWTLAPIWLLGLWVSFSTCLCHCLSVFFTKKTLLSLITVIAIPVNYVVGAKLTLAQFSDPIFIPLSIITLYW
ncbi:MAG: DUF2878 domain-containing protein, partial [Cellvibrionales bacterium]|nr:DUF2878 domain-containing protein [Cellvibrionales bacterium]